MKKVSMAIFASIGIFVTIISCSKSSNSDNNTNNSGGSVACDGVPKSFSKDVNPLIQTFCNQVACHNANSSNGPGALTNYAEVFDARARIRAQVAAGLMPQNTTLTTAQKNIIICWIDNGAPND